MFNMLNNLVREGKNSPMVCKFLLSVSAFPQAFSPGFERPFYLLERKGFRNRGLQAVGLRIASLSLRPGFIQIRTGKT